MEITQTHDYLSKELGNQQQQADTRDLTIVVPESDQLQIDCDSKLDELWLDHMLSCSIDNGHIVTIDKITTSAHGNKHYYLRWPVDIDPIMRVALQACFGSDRKREFLSLVRIMLGIPNPTVLFEKK